VTSICFFFSTLGMLLRFSLVLVYVDCSLRTNDAIGGKGELGRLCIRLINKSENFRRAKHCSAFA